MDVKLQDIYDKFADTYEENRGLGCGAGESFSRFFVERGWTVTGVDSSKRMLELASKYVPEMETIHVDMRQVEFEPGQFDAITAIYSLFHIPSDDHPFLFDRFHRWLSPKGKALFTYATREYTGSNEFDGYKTFMGQELYYSHKSPEELYQILQKSGFSIDSADYRAIGKEMFLWVTVSKPT